MLSIQLNQLLKESVNSVTGIYAFFFSDYETEDLKHDEEAPKRTAVIFADWFNTVGMWAADGAKQRNKIGMSVSYPRLRFWHQGHPCKHDCGSSHKSGSRIKNRPEKEQAAALKALRLVPFALVNISYGDVRRDR